LSVVGWLRLRRVVDDLKTDNAPKAHSLQLFEAERRDQMRIQQTDRILKESRNARHDHEVHEHDRGGMWQRAWRSLTGIFKRS
jgi:hypothetical protein